MAKQNVTLIAAANTFRVHPRTICRALTGEHNTYWYDDINEDVYAIRDIADAYGMKHADLRHCIEGRDVLLLPDEAAEMLKIKPRTFRKRVQQGRYKKISNGGIVRYLRSKIIEDIIANQE